MSRPRRWRLRQKVREHLKEKGVPLTSRQIFDALKSQMSGRVGPSNTSQIGGICARDPMVKSVGKVRGDNGGDVQIFLYVGG